MGLTEKIFGPKKTKEEREEEKQRKATLKKDVEAAKWESYRKGRIERAKHDGYKKGKSGGGGIAGGAWELIGDIGRGAAGVTDTLIEPGLSPGGGRRKAKKRRRTDDYGLTI